MVILCFETCFSKQNSAIRLKSYTLDPPKFLSPLQIFGLATLLHPRICGAYLLRTETTKSAYRLL